MKNITLILALIMTTGWSYSQTINTIAGNGVVAYTGDGGPATSASLKPQGIAEDRYGNIYFADDFSHRIRKISSTGVVTTVAGNGSTTYSGDGMAATASAMNPTGVAVDTFGNIYIADNGNQRIRMVNTSGIISTIAGTGTAGFSGDGTAATLAMIKNPYYIILDVSGNIYFSGDNRVRKINTSGIISTVAGSGGTTYGGEGIMATLGGVVATGIAVDASGNLYIADKSNNRIRKVNTSGIITTFAGNGTLGSLGDGGPATSAQLYAPHGIAFDSLGNLFVTDYSNYKIRKISTSGIITTFAGIGTNGFFGDGGPATSAKISLSTGITTDYYGVILSDNGNNRVRRVCFGTTAPSILISGLDTVCSGTSVSFTSSITGGGTAPTYQWQVNGVNVGTGSIFSYTPLNGDVVKCILTSNATCSFPDTALSTSINMVVIPTVVPTISISSSDTSVCVGTSVSFTSSITGGGTAPTYQWQVNGINVGTATTYSYIPSNTDVVKCIVTSNAACASPTMVTSAIITMTVNPLPISYSFGTSGTYIDSAVLSLSNSQIGVSYQLFYNTSASGTSVMGTGSPLSYHVFSTGNYFIIATSSFGCVDTMNIISVTIDTVPDTTTGVDNLVSGENVVYPNPFDNDINVSSPAIIKIYDMIGRSIYSSGIKSAHISLNLAPGMYMVSVDGVFHKMIKK